MRPPLGVVLAPGYGGTAEQPIVRALAERLAAHGILARPITFSTRGRRPSPDYTAELEDLRQARDGLLADGASGVALVGRSFGGRMCALLAADEPPTALVVLGYPIRPPGRQRPRDEAALIRLTCPTLVVQGDRDAQGPIAVLREIAGQNPRIELVVLEGVGHQFAGARQAEAIERCVAWVAALKSWSRGATAPHTWESANERHPHP